MSASVGQVGSLTELELASEPQAAFPAVAGCHHVQPFPGCWGVTSNLQLSLLASLLLDFKPKFPVEEHLCLAPVGIRRSRVLAQASEESTGTQSPDLPRSEKEPLCRAMQKEK